MLVYEKISAVTRDIGASGLAKNGYNKMQNFSFRGIDDLYNLINPILSSHGLCILPKVVSHEYAVLPTKSGTTNRCVLVIDFDIVAADGSKHTVTTVGEANDNGDKSTNKAMSIAYKYMALMVFAIPLVGNDDADASTIEAAVVSSNKTKKTKTDFTNDDYQGALEDINNATCLVNLRGLYAKITKLPDTTTISQEDVDCLLAAAKDKSAQLKTAAETQEVAAND